MSVTTDCMVCGWPALSRICITCQVLGKVHAGGSAVARDDTKGGGSMLLSAGAGSGRNAMGGSIGIAGRSLARPTSFSLVASDSSASVMDYAAAVSATSVNYANLLRSTEAPELLAAEFSENLAAGVPTWERR